MGKNTITATINETGESKSCTINILEPELIEGYWTIDKEGSTIIKEAKLGDTVYFQIHTKGIANHQKITLKLRDQDILFVDWANPDDSKFPDREVVETAFIKNDKATVELVLDESWESMLKDDADDTIFLDATLELYWKVSYGKRKKELPTKDDDYLRVGFSDRTLYFKTPTPSYHFPELISYEGDPILPLKISGGLVFDKLVDASGSVIDKQISKIALAKLGKGFMADNNGKVYTGERLIYEYKKLYTNSGELLENVRMGKNFGYNQGDGVVTTKGISQYDFFTQNGKRVKLLGLLKTAGEVYDFFDIFRFSTSEDPMNETLPVQLGALTPIAAVTGLLVQEQKAKMDMFVDEVAQMDINIAKLQGLEATRKAVESWNHNEDYQWDLLAISQETANKLLAGEFKTFEELYEFNIENEPETIKIEILYRKVRNNNREEDVYVIETIFINE
ncbi:MAG: hypothetical protein CR968_00195 [Flavobacteriia bacterium]|nr:MAG: hypothetical protein CR968_00195 [Flavobacteriia bacterium]